MHSTSGRRVLIPLVLSFVLVLVTACDDMEGLEGGGLGDLLEGLTEQLDGQVDFTTPTTPPIPGATTVPESSLYDLPDLGASILVPQGAGPFPTVVLVHGGSWSGGSPSDVGTLAAHLVSEGFLVVSPRYKLSQNSPGYPQALHDIACAVRMAAGHAQSDGTVALMGHSAGGHLGAVIALTGNRYGDGCPFPGSATPGRFVGLAGPYNVDRIGLGMVHFFGTLRSGNPTAWDAANPQGLASQAQNRSLKVLLVHGDLDFIVEPRHAEDFRDALNGAGIEVRFELLSPAGHAEPRLPADVGDLLVDWLRG